MVKWMDTSCSPRGLLPFQPGAASNLALALNTGNPLPPNDFPTGNKEINIIKGFK